MKVLMVTGSWEGPCYYRMILPAMILRERGHEVHATNVIHLNLTCNRVAEVMGPDGKTATQIVPTEMQNYDVIVWQYVWKQEVLEILNKLKRVAPHIRHIMDVDDDYFHLNPHNPWYAKLYGKESGRISNLLASIRIVDTLTVTTPFLADIYRKHTRRVEVLPNCIDNQLYNVKTENHGQTCGWYGVDARFADLWVLEGWIPEDMYCIIAACDIGFREMNHKLKLFVPAFTVLHLPEFLKHIDIGMVPLEDLQFNYSKSPLKGLEYSAAGLPFIASNVGVYQDFVVDGYNGLSVKKPRQWGRYLRELQNDEVMRRYLGANAKIHAENCDIRNNITRWEEVYGLEYTPPEDITYVGNQDSHKPNKVPEPWEF